MRMLKGGYNSQTPTRRVCFPTSRAKMSSQEVLRAMDQVLQDLMLELADEDQQAGMDDMEGGQGDEEIADIMDIVYNVRPLGLTAANIRDLCYIVPSQLSLRMLIYYRYRQTYLYTRAGHSSNSCGSRHGSRLLPLPHVFSYCLS